MTSTIRILLAEDNAGDVFLVEDALSAHDLNYTLSTAADGERALQLLNEAENGASTYDLLLLDLNLPKISGDRLLARVRQSDRLRGLPVIVVTSSDSPQDRAKVTELGADRYFRKPSNLQEFQRLGSLVRNIVQSRGNAQ